MKLNYHALLLALPLLFSCNTKLDRNDSNSKIKGYYEFEIYDSLVVDYKGQVQLMDISLDGNIYLLIDQTNSTIIVSDRQGEIQQEYNRRGEGPKNYGQDRNGLATFISNEEYIIPTTKGVFKYNLAGELIEKWTPDFHAYSSSIDPMHRNSFISDDKVYLRLEGRSREFGEGLEYQTKAKNLEVLTMNNGMYSPIIPFPKSSRFSSDKTTYSSMERTPIFSMNMDSLYVAFTNEAKLYSYHISQLDSPTRTLTIPFPLFIEAEGSEGATTTSLNARDFFRGTILNIIPLSNGLFIIDYTSGLTDEVAAEVISNGGQSVEKIIQEATKRNTIAKVIFDGKSISNPIVEPEMLGNLNKFVSNDEIWFTLDFSKVENDYSVIYKTRLKKKN